MGETNQLVFSLYRPFLQRSAMPHTSVNELRRELLGPSGLNPFISHDSSSRGQMFSSHLGQMLVIEGATPRTVFTGMEREYGKYTFCVEMPADGVIVAVIPRYAATLGATSVTHNPETLIIYENDETKVLDCFSIVDFVSNDQYFGFRYKPTKHLSMLRVGAYIEKGTKFLVSPSITEDGDYKYGVQANMLLATLPGVSEDGIIVSKSFCEKIAFKTYCTRTIQWGSDKVALNLYGTIDSPKIFPNIGDKVREDSILMALRSHKPADLAPINMLPNALMEPRVNIDELIYADGPGGIVVDVKIDHASYDRAAISPYNLNTQPVHYDNARRVYYQSIIDVYENIERKRHGPPRTTPQLHSLIVKALSVIKDDQTPKIIYQHRKTPLDVFRVEITIEYRTVPDIGFKLTGCHGDKGVICKIIPDEHMPVDEDGNRAEIIMDPNSTNNRANIGRLYEQFLCCSARDTYKRMCAALEIKPKTNKHQALEHLQLLDPAKIDYVWNKLLDFYSITSPKVRRWFNDGTINESAISYLSQVIEYGIRIYFPPDNEAESPNIVKQLNSDEMFKPVYGKISYVGNSGLRRVTTENFRIGQIYIIVLEKTGEDWGAVGSASTQHHGMLAPLTRADKHANPARLQPVRGTGEAEMRIIASYCGPETAAEILDRNTSPKTHSLMVETILRADKPGNINNLVDRSRTPFGSAQPNVMLDHLLFCRGIRFEHTNHIPDWEKTNIDGSSVTDEIIDAEEIEDKTEQEDD